MLPVYYSKEDVKAIEEFYGTNFEDYGETGFIIHEITSEYVHSDIMVYGSPEDEYVYASCGMGAKKMNTPSELVDDRCELFAVCNSPDENDSMIISWEIVRLTKYPFLNDTWFGTGHTVMSSKEFSERFGFYAFMLMPCFMDKLSLDCGNVTFLALAPIYKDEYDRIVALRNGSFEFMNRYFNELDIDEVFNLNSSRKHILV